MFENRKVSELDKSLCFALEIDPNALRIFSHMAYTRLYVKIYRCEIELKNLIIRSIYLNFYVFMLCFIFSSIFRFARWSLLFGWFFGAILKEKTYLRYLTKQMHTKTRPTCRITCSIVKTRRRNITFSKKNFSFALTCKLNNQFSNSTNDYMWMILYGFQ